MRTSRALCGILTILLFITLICAASAGQGPEVARGGGASETPEGPKTPNAAEVQKETRPLWMTISVFSLTEEGAGVVGDKMSLTAENLRRLREIRGTRELQRASFLAYCDAASGIFTGNKFPVTFYDSKASQYQVIFVDVGMKFMVRTQSGADGRLNITVNSTVSSIEDYRQEIERDTVFYFPSVKNSLIDQSFKGIRNDETVILSALRGSSVESMLRDIGTQEGFTLNGSTLMITLTPHILPPVAAVKEEKIGDMPGSLEMKTLCIPHGLSGKLPATYRMADETLASLMKGGARLLNSQRILMSGGAGSLVMGRKYPLTYFNSQAGGYQVIYTDIGLRDYFKCRPCGPRRWKVEVRHELANADPAALFGIKREQMPVRIYSVSAEPTMELGSGEWGVILSLEGEYFRKALKDILLPGIQLAPDDTVLFLVTIR